MSDKPKKLHAPKYALYWGEIEVAIIRDVTPFLETRKTREAWAVEHCLPTLKDGKKYKNSRQAALAVEKATNEWRIKAGLNGVSQWKNQTYSQ